MSKRPDLAALVVPLARALTAAELPVLARHGLSMWAYIVLSGLTRGDARTQASLAQAIGADKTRIIPVLDDLQERGLLAREQDPADRRAYVLSLTPAGRELQAAAQREIQLGEEHWLGRLTAEQRDVLFDVLRTLNRPAT